MIQADNLKTVSLLFDFDYDKNDVLIENISAQHHHFCLIKQFKVQITMVILGKLQRFISGQLWFL